MVSERNRASDQFRKRNILKRNIAIATSFGILILLTASACHSSVLPGTKAIFEACQPARTQAEISDCIAANRQQAEDVVQQALTELSRRLQEDEPALLEALFDSQEKWAAYATAQCDVDTYYSRRGTAYQAYVDACMTQFLQNRYEQLQGIIDNP